MRPARFTPITHPEDYGWLEEIDGALLDLANAFACLDEQTFARLPKPYKRICDLVMSLSVER